MSGETEDNLSGWTVDTLNYYFQKQLDDLRGMLDERYATQTKATDAAFAAQQKAMETAFLAADKAVQTALLSAEKAVNKAETAAEKRFESVNEFRGQLNDQAKTFMPRAEYDARHTNLEDRVTDVVNRMNRSEGQDAGKSDAVSDNRLNINMVAGLIGTMLAVISVIITLLVIFA